MLAELEDTYPFGKSHRGVRVPERVEQRQDRLVQLAVVDNSDDGQLSIKPIVDALNQTQASTLSDATNLPSFWLVSQLLLMAFWTSNELVVPSRRLWYIHDERFSSLLS